MNEKNIGYRYERLEPLENPSILKPVEELIPGINIDMETSKTEVDKFEDTGLARDTDFSHSLFLYLTSGFNTENMRLLGESFKNQIVVDLGAGINGKHAYFLSDLAGAKSYVGVEESFSDALERSLNKNVDDMKKSLNNEVSDNPDMVKELRGIPAAIAGEDMLTFLKRLPDNSVSIIMSGIDSNILEDPEYTNSVKSEVERVLSPDGAFLSNESISFSTEKMRANLLSKRTKMILFKKK